MRILIVAVLLVGSPFLQAARLDFGPERELVSRGELGLAPRYRERARVAAGAAGALVIWSDTRSGEWDVLGTRLDRDGAILDQKGLFLGDGIAGDVVWTGRAYLVAYAVHPLVYVRSVTPEGALGEPIPIVDTSWVQAHTVRLATDGSTVLLMTNSGRGAVLRLDGEKRREIDLGILPHAEFGLDIAVANDVYGLATVTSAGVAFRRIHAESDEPEQLLPGSSGATTVGAGSDGTSFLVAYDRGGPAPRLLAQRVGDPEPRALTSFAAAFPTIVWRGGDYLITFGRSGNIDAMAVRTSAAGEPLGEPLSFATATPPSQPDADRRPEGTGVAAWVTGSRVEVGFFDSAAAAPSDVKPISFSASEQHRVRVAAQGSEVFTMWREGDAVRLSRGVHGATVVTVAWNADPLDVLIDGDVVWAVWQQYPQGVHVQRYTRTLAPIDDAPLYALWSVSDGGDDAFATRFAAGGGSLLLVTGGGVGNDAGLYARIVREVDGALVAAPIFLPTSFVSLRPVAAWNGRAFVVAWAHALFPSNGWLPPPEELLTVSIGADGAILDPAPVAVMMEPRLIHSIESVRFGDDVVIVWQVSADMTPPRETFAKRVSSSLSYAISNPLERKLRSVAALGDDLLLLWTDDDDAEYVLLSSRFAEYERGSAPVPGADFDLASAGTKPVLAYARVAEEHGRVFRAFVRTTLPGRNRAPKHRAVRR